MSKRARHWSVAHLPKGSGNNAEMSHLCSEQLEELRLALRTLEPTGAGGFEGLVAVTLTEITGVPFRIAGSGSQYGVDGKPAYESDSICFEAKRYDGEIPRNEVLSKIAELSISDGGNIDLWVLGATSSVRSQLADDVCKLGEERGIGTFILDWTDIGIPPLAVALAMAETVTASFLDSHLSDKALVANTRASLRAILDIKAFAGHAARIRSALREPSLGIGIARPGNSEWLTDIFSSKQRARRFMGQPLAPQDLSVGKTLARDALVSRMRPSLTGRTDGRIVAVLGDEGVGKSWLVAQSWLCLQEKPLMIVLTADDFVHVSPTDALKDTIVGKLVQQTGARLSDGAQKRWCRKWERWRTQRPPNVPRLVVFIDGLNQRPELDWARLLEALTSELTQIGGHLIVTARTLYFRHRIKRRLVSPFTEIEVQQWREGERNEILAAHDIKGSDLHAAVAVSLRNPRLLGIALELLQKAQIRDLDELSASRLLFEHMHASERDALSPQPAHEFAKRLQDHATEILSRIDVQQRDDLKVFEGGLEAVSDGRFFVPVEGDPTRYTLAEDGLTLAFGFSVVDQLRFAHRNGHDLDTALAVMIEPISALDVMAEAIIAGLTIACLEEDCPVEIGAAVVRAFAGMQNPNTDHFPAFAGLARQRPEAFIKAARDLCLAGGRQPNVDWIKDALQAAKTDDLAWSAISEDLRSWMARYSLSLELGMFSQPSRDLAEEVEIERTKKQDEIDQRLRSLSPAEKELLESLERKDDGDLSILAHFAFELIAGKPVAPFAQGLAQWSFANVLNHDNGVPYKEFMQLVRFNRADWPQARAAILMECRVFEGPDASRTGKWALVNMLQAMGAPEDAARAHRLVAELNADRPRFEEWRLVEKYCASDPCDPQSKRPENITDTARDYAAIDVSKIRLGVGISGEDLFFSRACPGVARFVPRVAVAKHREFVADVLCREGFRLRQGLFELRHHNALLTRNDALQLVKPIRVGTTGNDDDTLREKDRWIVSQHRAMLAFPHLTAQEQLEALLSQPQEDDILRDVMDVVKPLDGRMFETLLGKAYDNGDDCAQHRILTSVGRADTRISEGARKYLGALVRSDSGLVRAQVLRLIARLGDDHLIEMVLQSGWSGAQVRLDGDYEAWYGSAVILEAAARNMILCDQALERIAPQFYGQAAKKLSADAGKDIAGRIGASILRATNLTIDDAIPDIEIVVPREDRNEPTMYRASEKLSDSDDPLKAWQRFSESEEALQERHTRLIKAFKVFKGKLTQAKAQIILDSLRIDEFDAIAAADWKLAERWYEMFIDLPGTKLVAVHSLGYLLAHALSASNPAKAASLFTLLGGSQPLVRITYGDAGISLDAMAIWSAADDPQLDTLRFSCLDRSENDHELAIEVLAALRNSRDSVLQNYIEKRLGTGEPAKIARALMVAGLSVRSAFKDEVLARYRDTAGFIRRTHAAAMYAYERNIWAEHWFRQMYETKKTEDFWRYSILFTKIVDGRFDVWQTGDRECGEPFRMFWPSVESRLKHRLERWQGHRKRKLFGDDAPASIFIYD